MEAISRLFSDFPSLRDLLLSFSSWAEGSPFSVTLLFGALALATLISEDLTCVAAGVMSAAGLLPLWVAVAACYFGIFIGDLLLYGAGALSSRSANRLAFFREKLPEERLRLAGRQFESKGVWLVVVSRFLPGSRLPVYFYSGFVGLGFFKFFLLLGVTCFLWTPLLVVPSFFFGELMIDVLDTYQSASFYAIPLLILGFFVAYKILPSLFSWEGRRLLWMRYKRIRHYEFWNTHVFYLPVYFYILYLGLRHRCLTLFTISNPFVEGSGIRGESKREIMRHFEGTGHAGNFFFLDGSLDFEEKKKAVEDFMASKGLSYPLAFKPDVGERGVGVFRAYGAEDLEAKLKGNDGDFVVQENVEGVEFGILYVRKPSESVGRIFSLSNKAMINLTGNGKSDLKRLILQHPRAVLMARFHLRKHERNLDRILKEGETFPLVDLGTHSMGSVFLDSNRLVTPELVQAVEKISRCVPHFHVGRYDVRVPSVESLQRGEGLKVLELNLVTGEPAHIYDPSNSIFSAYRTLFRLWKQVFQIGEEKRSEGFVPLSLSRLKKILF